MKCVKSYVVELMGRYSKIPDFSRVLQLTTPDQGILAEGARSRPEPRQRHRLCDRFDKAVLDRIVTNYQAGASSMSLGEQHGISKHAVLTLLKERGIQRRRQGLSAEQVSEAIELYEAGLSLARVSQVLSVPSTTIWTALRKAGVIMRGRHQPKRSS